MSNKKDDFGDRMKRFEKMGDTRLFKTLPIMARLDGKCFHNFTKGLIKPFDLELNALMAETTRLLVEDTNARVGYTQSDEITLIFYSDSWKSEIFMGGKSSKIISLLAAKVSVTFNKLLKSYLPSKADEMPLFDCRVWNVPNQVEAVNALIWREKDAVRNSIQMLGQSEFSHNELQGKSCNEIQDMLWKQKNINWNDLPAKLKRGTYVQSVRTSTKYTTEELELLPEKHQARTNPDLVIERRLYRELELPILTTIANVVDVIFNGDDPIMKEE
jgi:tRNA(His) guanylyltransferase